MAIGDNFDFSKYDRGGRGAVSGDGKLTGSEVEAAKRDGYNVFDGYKLRDSYWKSPDKVNKNIFAAAEQKNDVSKKFGNKNLKAPKSASVRNELIKLMNMFPVLSANKDE